MSDAFLSPTLRDEVLAHLDLASAPLAVQRRFEQKGLMAIIDDRQQGRHAVDVVVARLSEHRPIDFPSTEELCREFRTQVTRVQVARAGESDFHALGTVLGAQQLSRWGALVLPRIGATKNAATYRQSLHSVASEKRLTLFTLGHQFSLDAQTHFATPRHAAEYFSAAKEPAVALDHDIDELLQDADQQIAKAKGRTAAALQKALLPLAKVINEARLQCRDLVRDANLSRRNPDSDLVLLTNQRAADMVTTAVVAVIGKEPDSAQQGLLTALTSPDETVRAKATTAALLDLSVRRDQPGLGDQPIDRLQVSPADAQLLDRLTKTNLQHAQLEAAKAAQASLLADSVTPEVATPAQAVARQPRSLQKDIPFGLG